MEKVILVSSEVYEGKFRNIEIRPLVVICEFQPKFAYRVYSKYVKLTLVRKSIKSSTLSGFMAFKWNSQCEVCGFKAKNNRGLKIHISKKHPKKAPKKALKSEFQTFTPMRLRQSKRIVKKFQYTEKLVNTISHIENRSIREIYQARMENSRLRDSYAKV